MRAFAADVSTAAIIFFRSTPCRCGWSIRSVDAAVVRLTGSNLFPPSMGSECLELFLSAREGSLLMSCSSVARCTDLVNAAPLPCSPPPPPYLSLIRSLADVAIKIECSGCCSIGRWLAHSSSCPSCRSRVQDEEESPTDCPAAPPSAVAAPALAPRAAAGVDEGGVDPGVASTPTPALAPASAPALAEFVDAVPATRSIGSQAGQAEDDGNGGRGTGEGGEGAAPRGVGAPDVRAPFC